MTMIKSHGLLVCLFAVGLMSSSCDRLDDRNVSSGWTDAGQVVSTTSEGSFVGIGTKAPSSPFSVFKDGIPVSETAFAVAAFDPKIPDKGIWLGYDARSVIGILGADSDGKTASELAFWTHDGTAHGERMRLTKNGNVGIGVAVPDEKMHVLGDVHVQGASDCTVGLGMSGISCASDLGNADNVQEIAGALPKILSLRGVEFDENETSRHGIGLIAREVEEIFPMAVTADAQGQKRLDYAVLVAPLIGAVKEMNDEINDLKKQNAAFIQWICAKDPASELCRYGKE